MKSSEGLVKYVIGCWARPIIRGITPHTLPRLVIVSIWVTCSHSCRYNVRAYGFFFFFFSWARPKTTSVYTKEKFVKVTMMFKIPKRRILGPTLTTDMIQHGFAVGEAKEALYKRKRQAGTTTNKCHHNKPWLKCFLEKRKRRKEKTREWSNFLFSLSLSQNYPFLDIH